MFTRAMSMFTAMLALALLASAPALAQEKGGKGNTHEGIVVSAGSGKLTMTDKEGKNEHTHEVGTDAKVTCDGKEAKLEDLMKGNTVKVTTAKKGDKDVVVSIEAKKDKKE